MKKDWQSLKIAAMILKEEILNFVSQSVYKTKLLAVYWSQFSYFRRKLFFFGITENEGILKVL